MSSVQILDGGLGTSLQDKYGVKFDSSSTPLWASHLLVADPATLQACQQDFVSAGTDVLLTATYQVSTEGFERTKAADFPNGIPKSAIGPFLRTALDVAEQARGSASTKIALSLGPYGACMIPGQEYSGKYDVEHDDEEALFRWHLDRLRLFAKAEGNLIRRVQYVAFETLPRLDEVRAVRRAIRAAAIEVPFWISCVFPGEDDVLPDGSSIEQVVSAAVDFRDDADAPWGVGINCTKIHKLPSLVAQFGNSVTTRVAAGRLATPPCLVLYPDGTNGEVYNTTTQMWEKPIGASDGAENRVSIVVSNLAERYAMANLIIVPCRWLLQGFPCRHQKAS
jgi:homocysteine S-methyltransferase